MPVPAILGLSALSGVVMKVVEKVIDFFLSKVGQKILVLTAIFTGLTLAVTALFSAIGIYAEPLISSLPQDIVSLLGVALPSNTTTCLAAIVSVEAACITYALTLKTLEYQSKVA